jgi:2-polyprenyl-3-methyl-5-hydroxy-6-metoxy-1,4-benzoquinol methylase
MKIARIEQQEKFFDSKKNQHQINNIIFPSIHTRLEVDEILDKLHSIPGNEEIVDFGAGTGRITKRLLEANFSVLAIDISQSSLYELKNNFKNMGKLKIGKNIPKGMKYHAIVGADILHHIDMDTYLPIFFTHLKNKGKIVFSEPCAFNLAWYIYLSIFYDWNIEKGMMNCTHFNLQNKLKKYGFTKIKINGFGLFPTPLFKCSEKLCKLNDWLGSLPILKLFAYRYIIEASRID